LILYLFYIRKVFFEGTSKSLTAFFTVYTYSQKGRWRGEGRSRTREKGRGATVHKAGSKILA
jgi:hypothetical protein